jgi:endogenous inhibitor of DNA gyrase (YacG/DUF329 family)
MKCPGQDTQYWSPSAIFEVDCPKCGQSVEFFKDDTSRKCGNCDHRFVNPNMDFCWLRKMIYSKIVWQLK